MPDLERRLRAGETLVWTGRPDPGKHVGPIDVFLVPFSLLWGGFAAGWPIAAAVQDRASPGLFLAIPFAVVGVYVIGGRFVVKARRKRVTVYGLTGERALVAVGDTSFSAAPLAGAQIDQRRSRDGRHLTVTFGGARRSAFSNPSYANTGMDLFTRGSDPVAFYDVEDVDGLEAALLQG